MKQVVEFNVLWRPPGKSYVHQVLARGEYWHSTKEFFFPIDLGENWIYVKDEVLRMIRADDSEDSVEIGEGYMVEILDD